MFSPAEGHATPAAVNRSPSPASPGHWCDRPQPPAIRALCASDAVERSALNAYGARPFAVRAALMWSSTCSITGSPAGAVAAGVVVGDAVGGGVVVAGAVAGAVVGTAVVGAA